MPLHGLLSSQEVNALLQTSRSVPWPEPCDPKAQLADARPLTLGRMGYGLFVDQQHQLAHYHRPALRYTYAPEVGAEELSTDSQALPEDSQELSEGSPELSDMPEDDLPDLPEELPDLSEDSQELSDMPEELPDLLEDSQELPDRPEDDLPDLSEELPDMPEDLPDLPDMPEELPDMPEDSQELPEELPDLPEELPDMPEDDLPDQPDTPEGGQELVEQTPANQGAHTRRFDLPAGMKLQYDRQQPYGVCQLLPGQAGQAEQALDSAGRVIEETLLTSPQMAIWQVGVQSQGDVPLLDPSLAIIQTSPDLGVLPDTYQDLLAKSPDYRYQQAKEAMDASFQTAEGRQWLGVPDLGVAQFNRGDWLSMQSLQEAFLKRVNSKRKRPLRLDPLLLPIAELRAQEMALYGHIQVAGRSHVRPNGDSWLSAFYQLPFDYKALTFGESLLAYSILSNPYQVVSEQWIAERLIQQWATSPSHAQAMFDSPYTHVAVAVKLTTRDGAKNANHTNWMIACALYAQQVGESDKDMV